MTKEELIRNLKYTMKKHENDILWCTQHKLETRPTFLCYMYDVKAGIDAKHTPADQMKCETCTFCCRKEKKDDHRR